MDIGILIQIVVATVLVGGAVTSLAWGLAREEKQPDA